MRISGFGLEPGWAFRQATGADQASESGRVRDPDLANTKASPDQLPASGDAPEAASQLTNSQDLLQEDAAREISEQGSAMDSREANPGEQPARAGTDTSAQSPTWSAPNPAETIQAEALLEVPLEESEELTEMDLQGMPARPDGSGENRSRPEVGQISSDLPEVTVVTEPGAAASAGVAYNKYLAIYNSVRNLADPQGLVGMAVDLDLSI